MNVIGMVQTFCGRMIKLIGKHGLKFAFMAQTVSMRKLIFSVISILTIQFSFAQWQIGVFGGISNYEGDLVDKFYQSSKGAFGLNVGYQISSRVNLRAGLTLAKVAGADSLSSHPDLRLRNLSFQSNITEFSLVGEFNTFDLDTKRWSPYVFAGFAIYHFNPYAYDKFGNQIFLQPLSTEGEGLPGYNSQPYALTQLAIPIGGGIKYNISDNVRIAFEIGVRKLFTDYLDDVSGNYAAASDLLQYKGPKAVEMAYREDEIPNGDPNYPAKGITRGSPKYKDLYYLTGIHLTIILPESGNKPFSGSHKKGYGCPTKF